jgi:hypothetical protein
MTLSATAMFAWTTWYLSKQIATMTSAFRALADDMADMKPKVTDLLVRVGRIEVRQDGYEDLARERRDAEIAFRAEMRTMVGSLLRGVSQT